MAAHHEHSPDYYEVKTLLTWNAPARPFRKKRREYYVFVFIIAVLIEVILLSFHEYILMLLVLAVGFLTVVVASIPPRDYHYKITTQGIQIEDHFYIWEELYDFYFRRVDHIDTLVVRTIALLPGELRISLVGVDRDHVRQTVVQYLPYREVVRETFVEKSSNWLSKTLPLERES